MIGAIQDGFAFIPFEKLHSPSIGITTLEILAHVPLDAGEKRFNEGLSDPAGRFLAGTMGKAHGTHDGRMFAFKNGRVQPAPVKEGITCTNGMGWTENGRQMCVVFLSRLADTRYFTDSWDKRIDLYDYDLVRRKKLCKLTPSLLEPCPIDDCSPGTWGQNMVGQMDCASTQRAGFGQLDGEREKLYD